MTELILRVKCLSLSLSPLCRHTIAREEGEDITADSWGVCLPAVRGKYCGISIRRCARMRKTSRACVSVCIPLRDCRDTNYCPSNLATRALRIHLQDNVPPTYRHLREVTMTPKCTNCEPVSWFSSGERDNNNNTSAKSSCRINNNSGATC